MNTNLKKEYSIETKTIDVTWYFSKYMNSKYTCAKFHKNLRW